MKKRLEGSRNMLWVLGKDLATFCRILNTAAFSCRARAFSRNYHDTIKKNDCSVPESRNPLSDYFKNHHKGHGIWKWEHYFETYHRHFGRFIGKEVNILEIGIYSGGSVGMWRSYFGEKSHIYGVDIERACKAYENDHVSVFIGDQADRAFWRRFRESVESIDIIIDDGGHTPEQQQITLEEMLPHLSPGGVYICEDVHGRFNKFSAFAAGIASELNAISITSSSQLESSLSKVQSSIHSIHFYPYLVVIEKHHLAPAKFTAPKHGTEWQPFL